MKTKTMLIAVLAVVAGIIIAVVMNLNRPAATVAAPVAAAQPATSAASPTVATASTNPLPVSAASAPAPPVEPMKSNAAVKPAIQATAPPANAPIQYSTARAALSLVGADPDAEQYWAAAIFDPSLSDREREDLMEDLNEEGLSDPQNPSPEDMPLIVNRIRIIEAISPYADEFMQEHLGEAYKDLWNLLYGQPPR